MHRVTLSNSDGEDVADGRLVMPMMQGHIGVRLGERNESHPHARTPTGTRKEATSVKAFAGRAASRQPPLGDNWVPDDP